MGAIGTEMAVEIGRRAGDQAATVYVLSISEHPQIPVNAAVARTAERIVEALSEIVRDLLRNAECSPEDVQLACEMAVDRFCDASADLFDAMPAGARGTA